MTLEIHMDDFWQDQLRKRSSYLGKIPSEDFNEEQYEVFLNIASSEELEQDILTKETLDKMMEHFMKDGIRGIIWYDRN